MLTFICFFKSNLIFKSLQNVLNNRNSYSNPPTPQKTRLLISTNLKLWAKNRNGTCHAYHHGAHNRMNKLYTYHSYNDA